jgi:transposase
MTVCGAWDKVIGELGMIKCDFAVCYEASTGYGYIYDRLIGMARKVVVAHPGQLRLIFKSKRKNDRADAEKLAKLLYLDEVPAVYVPSVDVRSWRAMIEHRQTLLQERVRVKNAVRALLRSHGVVKDRGIWTKAGLAELQRQGFPTEMDALRRDIYLERLRSISVMMGRVERGLQEVAGRHGGVRLLMDIPGVGIRTSEAVTAYVDDVRRFARVKAAGSYFGLVPCQDQSAEKNRLGHITRQGPATVRKLLAEAAWQGIRRSAHLREYFERVQQGNPERKKIALVATAHHLLRVMVAMLRTGEAWRYPAA